MQLVKRTPVISFDGWPGWLLATVLVFLLYIPILGNTFLSDDWLVLKKLILDKEINTEGGFFRPLSDITIWLTWKAFGLNALPFYITQLLLHALNGWLIYRYCMQTTGRSSLATIAALLFLTYPFHNEANVWIVGRGALMANTLGFLALVLLTGKFRYKFAGVAICWFVGLTAYESVIVLPAIVLLHVSGRREKLRWMGLFAGVFAAHLVLRWSVANAVVGYYGSGIFGAPAMTYLSNIYKVIGRLVLPPMHNSTWLMVLFVPALAVIVLMPRKVIACLLIACIIPFVAGVSTHTSEGDRFLHFPSYFLCIGLAYLLVDRPRWLLVPVFAYQLFFLEKNNLNWRKASNCVQEILSKPPVDVSNVPGDIEGAYVFRNGYREALLLTKP